MAKTSLSSGISVYSALSKDTKLKKVCPRIYPVLSLEEENLPYITYTRTASALDGNKSAKRDDFTFEISCFAETYAAAVDIAELARDTLEGQTLISDALVTSFIQMQTATESWQDGAYIITLSFRAKAWEQ